MKHVARLAAVAAVLTSIAVIGACPLARSAKADDHKASAKSAKDVAACERMCEVAGDAEENKAAVSKCKKKCND